MFFQVKLDFITQVKVAALVVGDFLFVVEVVEVAISFPFSSTRSSRRRAKKRRRLLKSQHAFPANVEKVRLADRRK